MELALPICGLIGWANSEKRNVNSENSMVHAVTTHRQWPVRPHVATKHACGRAFERPVTSLTTNLWTCEMCDAGARHKRKSHTHTGPKWIARHARGDTSKRMHARAICFFATCSNPCEARQACDSPCVVRNGSSRTVCHRPCHSATASSRRPAPQVFVNRGAGPGGGAGLRVGAHKRSSNRSQKKRGRKAIGEKTRVVVPACAQASPRG